MAAQKSILALSAMLSLVKGQGYTKNGNIAACRGQLCQDCPVYASTNEGYPNCLIYNSADNLAGYESDSGNGFDVWWNSGPPNPGCQIIVRTPASQDISNCGYYERGWGDAGCYYTLVRQSFMLQYCCGQGDCDAAAPATSIAEAHTMQAQGLTAITSLEVGGMSNATEGKRWIGEGLGEISWSKRNPSSMSQLARNTAEAPAEDADAALAARDDAHISKRNCHQYTEKKRYTKAGRQVKVSPTQDCNSSAGCSIKISSSVTTGRTMSVSAGITFDIFSASTGIEFHKEKTRSITNTYTQSSGTRGYVTFSPTFVCTNGPVSDCSGKKLQEGTEVTACTPRLLSGGSQDGTYSFVYE